MPWFDEEEPVTARDESSEPSGEEDPANEAELDAAREEAESQVPEPRAQSPEPDDELTAMTRERDEYLALAQRTQADFENWRKRAAKEAVAAAASQQGRSDSGGMSAEELDSALSRLADMKERGLITQEEFDQKKRELLDRLR